MGLDGHASVNQRHEHECSCFGAVSPCLCACVGLCSMPDCRASESQLLRVTIDWHMFTMLRMARHGFLHLSYTYSEIQANHLLSPGSLDIWNIYIPHEPLWLATPYVWCYSLWRDLGFWKLVPGSHASDPYSLFPLTEMNHSAGQWWHTP